MSRPRIGADNKVGRGNQGGELLQRRFTREVYRIGVLREVLPVVPLEIGTAAGQDNPGTVAGFQVLDHGCIVLDPPVPEIAGALAAARTDHDERMGAVRVLPGKREIRSRQRNSPAQIGFLGADRCCECHHRFHRVLAACGGNAAVREQPLEIARTRSVESESDVGRQRADNQVCPHRGVHAQRNVEAASGE